MAGERHLVLPSSIVPDFLDGTCGDFCLARNSNLTRHCNDTHTTLRITSHRSWSAFQHRIQDDVSASADATEPVRPAAAAALGGAHRPRAGEALHAQDRRRRAVSRDDARVQGQRRLRADRQLAAEARPQED